MPRLSEFPQESPEESDFVIGYRPGYRGIRVVMSTFVARVAELVGAYVNRAAGQTGTVTRLFLIADDGSRHEVIVRKAPGITPTVYELAVDQNHTPE